MADFTCRTLGRTLPLKHLVLAQSLVCLELCKTHGLFQCVSKSTRGSNALDLEFTNECKSVDNVRVAAPIGNSDHASVHFQWGMLTDQTPIVAKRNIKKAS